jgi:hypothetical protein
MVMPRKKKKANEMTDKELLRFLFPKKIVDHVRKVAIAARKKAKK